jgi:4'-phosphopantetheinyl transferase
VTRAGLIGVSDLWPDAPRHPHLQGNEVQVWRLNVTAPASCRLDGADLLSGDEQTRAARLRFVRDRDRFRRSRAALRLLLAAYTGIDPAQVLFRQSDHGKPYLDPDGRSPDIRFNVSHSRDMALFAVAWQREVGIDVEYIRPLDDLGALMTQICTAEEQAELDAVSAAERGRAFLRLWTYKEACMKAAGMGLLAAPDQIQVAGGRSTIQVGSISYSVNEVPVPAHYTAALAVEGPALAVRHW